MTSNHSVVDLPVVGGVAHVGMVVDVVVVETEHVDKTRDTQSNRMLIQNKGFNFTKLKHIGTIQ